LAVRDAVALEGIYLLGVADDVEDQLGEKLLDGFHIRRLQLKWLVADEVYEFFQSRNTALQEQNALDFGHLELLEDEHVVHGPDLDHFAHVEPDGVWLLNIDGHELAFTAIVLLSV
jgi:hypothetical protein